MSDHLQHHMAAMVSAAQAVSNVDPKRLRDIAAHALMALPDYIATRAEHHGCNEGEAFTIAEAMTNAAEDGLSVVAAWRDERARVAAAREQILEEAG